MGTHIEVGDWVVGGRNADDIDFGEILSLDCGKHELEEGDAIGGEVAWAWSMTRTWCPVGAQNDFDVFATRASAEAEAERRREIARDATDDDT